MRGIPPSGSPDQTPLVRFAFPSAPVASRVVREMPAPGPVTASTLALAAALPSPRFRHARPCGLSLSKTDRSRLGVKATGSSSRRARLCTSLLRRHPQVAAMVRRVRSLGQRHSIARMQMAQIPRSPILRHSVRRPPRVMHRGSPGTRRSATRKFSDSATLPVDRAQHTHDHLAALMGFDSILPFAGFAPSTGEPGVSTGSGPACRSPAASSCPVVFTGWHRGRLMIVSRPP